MFRPSNCCPAVIIDQVITHCTAPADLLTVQGSLYEVTSNLDAFITCCTCDTSTDSNWSMAAFDGAKQSFSEDLGSLQRLIISTTYAMADTAAAQVWYALMSISKPSLLQHAGTLGRRLPGGSLRLEAWLWFQILQEILVIAKVSDMTPSTMLLWVLELLCK